MGRLDQKVAIVSGGSKGMGYAISTTLAREGATVIIADLQGADEAAREIVSKGGKSVGVTADLTTETGRADIFAKAVAACGKVDIVVNNAGWGCKKPLIETDMESYDRSIDLNMTATYFMTQLAAKQMIAQGTGGRIINISSTGALSGERNSSIYAATKAAIIAFSRAAALELGEHGINVNCVLPGFTRTGNNDHVPEAIDNAFIAITPTGRVTVAQDVANAVAFLASDEASQISAQCLAVDGGFSGTRAVHVAWDSTMERT